MKRRAFMASVSALAMTSILPSFAKEDTDSKGNMSMIPSEPGAGSVFTIDIQKNMATEHWVDETANTQIYDVAKIEFEDDGSFGLKVQLDFALERIKKIRLSEKNTNGALVIVFIHGWHHSARWDVVSNTGDDHFAAFREVLKRLALREAERYPRGQSGGRRVIGIYLGWNGDPAKSVLSTVPLVRHHSFWDRYSVAKSIASGENVQEALRSIVLATKEPIASRPESPLILVGHSMGALMLESAFLSLLTAPKSVLAYPPSSNEREASWIECNGKKVSFPDVLIALNSAADSKILKEIKAQVKQQGIEKKIAADGISYSPPLLISVTSTADLDTKDTWRKAQALGDLVQSGQWTNRFTDGHDPSLITHTFSPIATNVVCKPKNEIDFGQNWHCLRAPYPSDARTPTFAIDLPTCERKGICDKPPHTRYELAPHIDKRNPELAWVFQVNPEIMSEHNDIFNSRSASLLLALIQISGAVVSLQRM